MLQMIAMPDITEEQIHQLLKDQVANAYHAGFANGWDSAVDAGQAVFERAFRHTPRSR
jgi:hypothetical protein